MAGEACTIHSKAMAAVLSLINITRCPGPFQQHHVPRSVQGETKTTCPEGGEQKIAVPFLKTIHSQLTLRRTLRTNQQLAPQPLLQQDQRFNETAEKHHRLASIEQLAQQLDRSRKLELGSNAS